MTTTPHCQTCGRPLTEDGLGGLCASCILKLVVDDAGRDAASPSGGLLLNIPGYEVREEIARGGMGIVYRARQLEPEREVALKMMLPHQMMSAGLVERFHLEARAIATLEHAAILPVFHVGEHNGLPFFTMRLVTGGTLAGRKGHFAGKWRELAQLIATLADAVQFAHERGVLHRDLKPGNVLFDDAGRPYVSDFGLAKLMDEDTQLTRSVELLGTPHYVAPEVAAHSARAATTASDIYSLGAIFYEVLAGRPPFEAAGVPALLKKIAEDEPKLPRLVAQAPRPTTRSSVPEGEPNESKRGRGPYGGAMTGTESLPHDLEVICLKCLAKDPARRYATAHEVAEDLRRWLEGRTILARPATRLERVGSWTRRNPALAFMTALLALVLLAAMIWQARSNWQLQHALAESLVRQARLERSTGWAGQRLETLRLVHRAYEHLRTFGTGMSASNLVVLRSEAAAALALPDVRPLGRWPAHITHFENVFDFSANLERYVTGAPDGGFTVFSLPEHKAIYHHPGATNDPAIQLRLSADGEWTAARYQGGQAELHSLEGGRPPRRWPGDGKAGAIFAFAPALPRMAVITHPPGKSRMAAIFDLHSGDDIAEVSAGDARHLAFNETATHLAVAGAELAVWRLADSNRLWAVPLPYYPAAVDWSPDGRRLALSVNLDLPTGNIAPEHDRVLLFNAATGQRESGFGDFVSVSARLEFSPDSQSVIAATWADQLMWASAPTKEFRLTIPGAQRALRFSPDGRKVGYSPSREELGLLELVNPAGWHEWRMTSAPTRSCFSIDVSSDGRWVTTGAVDGVHLWDAEERVEVASHPVPSKPWWMPVLFGPDGFLYYSSANFGVRRVELDFTRGSDGRTRVRFGKDQLLGASRDNMALGLAADGRSLIVGENRRQALNDRIPPTVWLWSNGNPRAARKLAENFPNVGYRTIPGSRWAVTTDRVTSDAIIWDFETGERVRGLGIPQQVNSEPTRNGRWLATRTSQEFAVWEVGTWNPLARWPVRPDEQENGSIVSSKDSRLLATDTSGGAFVLRELPTGEEFVKLIAPRPLAVRDWIFSPDSKRLIILLRNGQVVEWNLAELRREFALLGLE